MHVRLQAIAHHFLQIQWYDVAIHVNVAQHVLLLSFLSLN